MPGGAWFGSFLAGDADAAAPAVDAARNYALVGCTVAPGFDFGDFELARRDALLREFPSAAADIVRLTDAAT